MTELIGITTTGVPTRQACQTWLQYRDGIPSAFITIPGLDADKCRCADCLNLNPRGIWWVDQRLRDRILRGKRIISGGNTSQTNHD